MINRGQYGFFTLAVGIGVCLFGTAAKALETIRFVADDWCPYTCAENSIQRGIGVDIAQSILLEQGLTLEYTITSWEEAIASVRRGDHDVIIGTLHTETPDLLFPIHYFSYSKTCFVHVAGSTWHYTGIESLHGKRVGILAQYSYGNSLDDYLKQHGREGDLYIASNSRDLFNALDRGRIDLFVEDDKVVAHLLSLDERAFTSYEVEGCQPRTKLYYALTRSTPSRSQRILEILEAGLLKALTDGTVQRIHLRYGIEDY